MPQRLYRFHKLSQEIVGEATPSRSVRACKIQVRAGLATALIPRYEKIIIR